MSWYINMQLNNLITAIKENFNDMSRSFVANGYYIKQIRDRELYVEMGYQDIWEFADKELGVSKSSVSRLMAINDKFSIDGNSPILLEEYKDFSSSKLSEMLTLSDNQLKKVKAETTVKEIREMKPKKDKPKEESTMVLQQAPKLIDDLDLSVGAYNALVRAGITTIDKLKEKADDDLAKLRNVGNTVLTEIKEKLEVATSQQEIPNPPYNPALLECNPINTFEQESNVVAEAEYKEVPELIYNGEDIFNDYLKSNGTSISELVDEVLFDIDTSDRNQFRKTQIRNKLISKLFRYTESFSNYVNKSSNKESNKYVATDQPELPILKNNDQRKEFIDAYETWPLWIDQPLTGERYYRYDLTDKVAMVVRVYKKHGWENHKESKDYKYSSEQYYLLGVKSEWSQKGPLYKADETRTFYECSTNKSTLVEYLKEFQRVVK